MAFVEIVAARTVGARKHLEAWLGSALVGQGFFQGAAQARHWGLQRVAVIEQEDFGV